MKSKRYIEEQKAIIRRERSRVVKAHFWASIGLIVLLVILLINVCSQAHPDTWQEVTTAMLDCEQRVVFRQNVLTLNTMDGIFYVYRNPVALKSQLEFGHTYTFTYAENGIYPIVTEFVIDGKEYINYEESVEIYYSTVTALWALTAVIAAVCGIVNAVVYRKKTRDSIRRICACRASIRE